jgi:uncharacterized protein
LKQTQKYIIIFIFTFLLTDITPAQENTSNDIAIIRDGLTLKGKFYSVEGTGSFTTVILLHGFPGNETDVLGVGKKLSEAGINALTFNYSGTWQSEGRSNFPNTLKDIEAAYDFIHQPENIYKYKIDTTRIVLGGYSYGGGMALTYAANHPEIKAVFSIAGTDHGEFMKEYNRNPAFAQVMDASFEKLKAPNGPARFGEYGIPKEISGIGIETIEPMLDLRLAAPLITSKEILLIAGWNDANVTVENHVLPLYRALQKEKADKVTIVAFRDDHAFRKVRLELAERIIKWIKSINIE